VFGRYRGCKSFSPEGQVRSKVAAMPMTDWKVLLKDKHPGYIRVLHGTLWVRADGR
jgi:hypothetical protein